MTDPLDHQLRAEDVTILLAERDRLREALENVAAWDAEKALRFGNVGVREYAESVLRPESEGA